MKHIQQLIEAHGGLDAVQTKYLRIENEPLMRLVIEVVSGPLRNGAYEVSVAHYGEQNGDAMRDPEITFLVTPSAAGWQWTPLTFLNDYLGAYQVAGEYDLTGTLTMADAKLQRELTQFAGVWDRNLKHQGFIEAFHRKYQPHPSA